MQHLSLAERQRPVNQFKMVPLATEILLEGTDGLLRPAPEGNGGHRSTPLVFSRDGDLLPSSDADVRSPDDVITFEGRILPTDLRKIGAGQEILAKMHARFVFFHFCSYS